MAAICFVYKNLISFTIFISCAPNTPRIFYKPCSWCSIFICVCVDILLFMQSPILSVPPTFPGAVTLLDVGSGPMTACSIPKLCLLLGIILKAKSGQSASSLVSTSSILVPLLLILPSVNPLHAMIWMSHKCNMEEAKEIRCVRVCTMYKVSMGLEASIGCFPGCKNSYLSQFQAANTVPFNTELGEAVLQHNIIWNFHWTDRCK